MAARTEVASLAAEGEQVIMATVIAINPGKPFVQVAAVDKSADAVTYIDVQAKANLDDRSSSG